jgi:hypothetical protein
MAQVVEYLPSKHKTLSSTMSTTKKKKKTHKMKQKPTMRQHSTPTILENTLEVPQKVQQSYHMIG